MMGKQTEMVVRFSGQDFTFKPQKGRLVHIPHVGRHIHIVRDHASARRRADRPWIAVSKDAHGWHDMKPYRSYVSAENAARAALEFWGF